ncbi:MAG: lipopolysaccharide transport periplasmic protein LptA [Proteobacteria bacterium]|nr:lipopolysaccharide transport periplasmic protein LptA [Pseudomonadota bacterium]
MLRTAAILAILIGFTALPPKAEAQGATVSFGGLKSDTSQPVEVTSDELAVNQTDGTAIFTGNVVVVQGDMRLAAESVRVEYAKDDKTKVDRIIASGGVTLVSATEAAEGKEAVYTVGTGEVVMTGDVLLTQNGGTIAGQKLVVDLDTGTGRMDGRVKTVLQPKAN